MSDAEHRRPVQLVLQSADVVHSFWLPQLAGKVDLVPNHENTLTIDADVAGTFTGQCAEYCGTQHAKMLLRVVVQPPEEFEEWVRAQREPAVEDPRVTAGRDVFLETACINCQTVRGTVANGRFGPDLTHFMSRTTLGSGAALNTPDNLADWMEKPTRLKPGVLMPAMQLPEADLERLSAYLLSLE
jgi:cytochrome c oxidase subunit 2